MGALVGKVAMNRNCPPGLSESVEEMVQGYEDLINEGLKIQDETLKSLVRPIITPRFIPSCTPEYLPYDGLCYTGEQDALSAES